MTRDPIDALRSSDAPLPVPPERSQRIQERMFAALDAAADGLDVSGSAAPTEAEASHRLGEVDVVVDLESRRWAPRRWSGSVRRVGVAAALLLIAGLVWTVARSAESPDPATEVEQGPTDPVDDGAVSDGLARLDIWCVAFLPSAQQWDPPLGSIDNTQIPAAIESLTPVVDELVGALSVVDRVEPEWQSVRDEVDEIEAQFRAEADVPSGSQSIHILPLVARRLVALAEDLTDLGAAGCVADEE